MLVNGNFVSYLRFKAMFEGRKNVMRVNNAALSLIPSIRKILTIIVSTTSKYW